MSGLPFKAHPHTIPLHEIIEIAVRAKYRPSEKRLWRRIDEIDPRDVRTNLPRTSIRRYNGRHWGRRIFTVIIHKHKIHLRYNRGTECVYRKWIFVCQKQYEIIIAFIFSLNLVRKSRCLAQSFINLWKNIYKKNTDWTLNNKYLSIFCSAVI